jgi:restriction system protein
VFSALQGWLGMLLVAVLLLAFFVSVQKRLRRLESAARMQPDGGLASLVALNKMTWKQFELLVHQAFRHRGFVIGETGATGADGAVDLVLRKAGEYFLVHSRLWRAPQVDVVPVRELHSAMRAKRAAGGFVVTTGSYTREAMAFASGRNIQLIDGPTLREMLNDSAGIPTGVPTVITISEPSVIPTITPAAPACPECKSAMVLRMGAAVASAGSRGGQSALAKNFWSCSRFPRCKGNRDVA